MAPFWSAGAEPPLSPQNNGLDKSLLRVASMSREGRAGESMNRWLLLVLATAAPVGHENGDGTEWRGVDASETRRRHWQYQAGSSASSQQSPWAIRVGREPSETGSVHGRAANSSKLRRPIPSRNRGEKPPRHTMEHRAETTVHSRSVEWVRRQRRPEPTQVCVVASWAGGAVESDPDPGIG